MSQKRSTGADNYVSVARAHSPSPRKTVLTARRRHSTPHVSTLRFVERRSPQANPTIRQYYINSRATRAARGHSAKSDRVKSPPRPTTLVKPRHPDERITRLPTTPTSPCFNNDVFLPAAKRNRTIIIDTPSPAAMDNYSISPSATAKKQWEKREKSFSVDFSSDVFLRDGEPQKDYTYHTMASKRCKCCYGKCFCRFSYCNFQQCHYSCPLWCWIVCVLLVFGVSIGIVLFVGFSSH